MASKNRRIIISTRERASSTDFNNATALHHRLVTELVAAVLNTSVSASFGTKQGVLRGFVTTANGSDLILTLSAGIALMNGTAATSFDSDIEIVELAAATTIDLTGVPDPTNPRWVAIEMEPGETTEAQSLRDIFDPLTGNPTPQTVDKIKASSPTLTVVQGTAAATPVFPDGTSGRIPVAYVYVEANATSIAAGDVVLCRPMLSVLGDSFGLIRGGGVNATSPAGSVITLQDADVRFPDSGIEMTTTGVNFDFAASGTPNIDSAATYPPAADSAWYVYACKPPYPPGYGSDVADREISTSGTRVPSYSNSLIGGVLGVTTDFPATNSLQGEPSLGATIALTDPVWGNGGTVDDLDAAYLGSFRMDTSGDAAPQETRGGEVFIDSSAPKPDETDIQNNSDSGLSTGSFRKTNPLSDTGDTVLPVSASLYRVHIDSNLTSGTNALQLIYGDVATSWAEGEWYRDESSSSGFARGFSIYVPSTSGAFSWQNECVGAAGSNSMRVIVTGYVDQVLSLR